MPTPDSCAQLTISRQSAKDLQQRQIILTLDGRHLETLMYGQTVTRELSAGHHTICANNTFQKKTIEVDLAPREHARFTTINQAGRLTWFLVAAFGTGPMYVSLVRDV
jgi:hypothetical protein